MIVVCVVAVVSVVMRVISHMWLTYTYLRVDKIMNQLQKLFSGHVTLKAIKK